ncbi:MAG: hypothetical protein RLO17_19740 [Cyclobacteriaceae bacterium]
MKLNIHPYKIVALVISYIIFFGVILYVSIHNDLKTYQLQLKIFYDASLSNCEISNVVERPFPGGRGTYKLFTTGCNIDYYPISPEPYSETTVNLFSKGTIVNKQPKSTSISIARNGLFERLNFRNFEDEDSRPFTLKVIAIALLIYTIIVLISPNSSFEKWGS